MFAVKFELGRAVCLVEQRQVLLMVHKRSIESRHRRNQRAVARGYVSSAPSRFRHILVEDSIAPRVASMARSLAFHGRHNGLNSHVEHFARSASLAAHACGSISGEELRVAQAAHRSANRAKHDWRRHHCDGGNAATNCAELENSFARPSERSDPVCPEFGESDYDHFDDSSLD